MFLVVLRIEIVLLFSYFSFNLIAAGLEHLESLEILNVSGNFLNRYVDDKIVPKKLLIINSTLVKIEMVKSLL